MSLHHNTWKLRSARTFVVLSGIMISCVLLAEVIGGKMFSLESFFGMDLTNIHILGYSLDMNLPMTMILWPFVFVLSDVINDYYGLSGIRFTTWFALIVVILAVIVLNLAVVMSPTGYYVNSHTEEGISNMNTAFELVLLRTTRVLIGSMFAFIVAMFLNAWIFRAIKKNTASKRLWLRSLVSSIIAQSIGTFIYLFVTFNICSRYQDAPQVVWPMKRVLAVGTLHILYETAAVLLLLPVLYLIHGMIAAYMGTSVSNLMVREAVKN